MTNKTAIETLKKLAKKIECDGDIPSTWNVSLDFAISVLEKECDCKMYGFNQHFCKAEKPAKEFTFKPAEGKGNETPSVKKKECNYFQADKNWSKCGHCHPEIGYATYKDFKCPCKCHLAFPKIELLDVDWTANDYGKVKDKINQMAEIINSLGEKIS